MINKKDKIIIQNILDSYLTKEKFDIIIVLFGVVFGAHLNWSLDQILVFAFAIYHFLKPINSKYLANIVLVNLALIPLLLIIHRENIAESFANTAYSFLILYIITILWETRKSSVFKIDYKKYFKIFINNK